jgi:hypothetical protein
MKVLVPIVFDPLFGRIPEQIAVSAMRLLISPEFEGASGRLFSQIKRFKAVESGAHTRGGREGQRLWDFSEQLAAAARATGL